MNELKPFGHVLSEIRFHVVWFFRYFHFLQFLVCGFSWFCDFLVQKKLRPDANGLICIFAAIYVCLAHVEGKELQNNTCMQTDSLIALCLMSQRES